MCSVKYEFCQKSFFEPKIAMRQTLMYLAMSRNIKNGLAPSSPPPSAASSMYSSPVKTGGGGGGGGLRPRPADFPDAAASGKRKSLIMFQAMETQSEADLHSLKSKVTTYPKCARRPRRFPLKRG